MKINTIELIISAVRESQYPTDNKEEFLLVGRSNVGKSSFINTIINNIKARPHTIDNPLCLLIKFNIFSLPFYIIILYIIY